MMRATDAFDDEIIISSSKSNICSYRTGTSGTQTVYKATKTVVSTERKDRFLCDKQLTTTLSQKDFFYLLARQSLI